MKGNYMQIDGIQHFSTIDFSLSEIFARETKKIANFDENLVPLFSSANFKLRLHMVNEQCKYIFQQKLTREGINMLEKVLNYLYLHFGRFYINFYNHACSSTKM